MDLDPGQRPRATEAISRGKSGTPPRCRACATRWASSAWIPGHVARISSVLRREPRGRDFARPRHRAGLSRLLCAAVTPTLHRQSVPAAVVRSVEGSRREERSRDVSLPGVGKDRHDPSSARLGADGHLERRPHRRPTRDPGQHALARASSRARSRSPPRRRRRSPRRAGRGSAPAERIRRRCPGSCGARAPAREHRGAAPAPRRSPDSRGCALEHLARTRDRPAGPDSGHEHVHPAIERFPDLRAGGATVDLRVGGIRELIG